MICDAGTCIREEFQCCVWLYCGISRIYEATKIALQAKVSFRKTLDAKAAVDKEWKKLETVPSWELERSQEQEGGCSRSTKKQKESPRCYTDGPMSFQECGVKTQILKSTKAESCSVVTL